MSSLEQVSARERAVEAREKAVSLRESAVAMREQAMASREQLLGSACEEACAASFSPNEPHKRGGMTINAFSLNEFALGNGPYIGGNGPDGAVQLPLTPLESRVGTGQYVVQP